MKKIKKINIKLNGKKTNVISLYKILKNFNISTNKVAIELNKEIVNKKKLSSIKIRNNDSIEIVHFIGGG
jgi:thiamine biosynthesis protein ThiS